MFEIFFGGTEKEVKYCVVAYTPDGRVESWCGSPSEVRRYADGARAKTACLVEFGPGGKPRTECGEWEKVKSLVIKLK